MLYFKTDISYEVQYRKTDMLYVMLYGQTQYAICDAVGKLM